MKTKHTNGKLILCPKSGTNDLCRVKDDKGGIVADFYWLGEGRSQSEAEGNARLFYASPDLLEALSELLTHALEHDLHAPITEKAKSAIEKVNK